METTILCRISERIDIIVCWLTDQLILLGGNFLTWTSEHLVRIIAIAIVGYIIYLVGAKIIARIVSALVLAASDYSLQEKDVEKRQCTLSSLAVTIWKILAFTTILLTICEQLFPNVSLSAVVASLGVVGVAIGFGAQSLVRDFLSGIFIISENQYRVGDIVQFGNANPPGKVERVGTRSTTIRDLNGNVHFFPNGSLIHVINQTMGYSNSFFDVRVRYDNDVKKAIKVINSVGQKLFDDPEWKDKITKVPHVERVSDFTGAFVTISVIASTIPSEQWNVASEMRLRLIAEFKKHDIQPA